MRLSILFMNCLTLAFLSDDYLACDFNCLPLVLCTRSSMAPVPVLRTCNYIHKLCCRSLCQLALEPPVCFFHYTTRICCSPLVFRHPVPSNILLLCPSGTGASGCIQVLGSIIRRSSVVVCLSFLLFVVDENTSASVTSHYIVQKLMKINCS